MHQYCHCKLDVSWNSHVVSTANKNDELIASPPHVISSACRKNPNSCGCTIPPICNTVLCESKYLLGTSKESDQVSKSNPIQFDHKDRVESLKRLQLITFAQTCIAYVIGPQQCGCSRTLPAWLHYSGFCAAPPAPTVSSLPSLQQPAQRDKC